MNGAVAAAALRKNRVFLQNVLKDFKPEHAEFRPTPDMMTVTQQIRHIAHTIHWFFDGGFDDNWDMDFEKFQAYVNEPSTLEDALKALDAAVDRSVKTVEKLTEAELAAPMKDNPIFGTAPRLVTISADTDHMAHHRGILTVYLRLLGVVPTMVYTE
jgi:uncharacterized damage-inducible protein DinB